MSETTDIPEALFTITSIRFKTKLYVSTSCFLPFNYKWNHENMNFVSPNLIRFCNSKELF